MRSAAGGVRSAAGTAGGVRLCPLLAAQGKPSISWNASSWACLRGHLLCSAACVHQAVPYDLGSRQPNCRLSCLEFGVPVPT